MKRIFGYFTISEAQMQVTGLPGRTDRFPEFSASFLVKTPFSLLKSVNKHGNIFSFQKRRRIHDKCLLRAPRTANTVSTGSAANVILATGGYGNNKEMLTDEMKSALYYGPATSTGEGIQMAQAVGAQTANMEYGKRYPNGIEVDTGLAKSTIAGNIAGWTMSAILVNQEGNRVVNEKASNRTILETELQQTGGELFLLLDSETFEVWKSKLSEAGISESDIEKYLEANGTTTPVFAHGETLEEAAAAAGIDADALKATVERYNGFVAAGADEDFGRAEAYLTMPIGDGPYYIIEQKPRFATTMGGLVVNTSMQVLSTSGSPIAGLYAAGENCGQVMGDDSPSGANNAWAITSGKLGEDAIAAK